ncbi:MAG TPA: hypothetical protein VKT72_18185 [Candidatus Baltobacteraceae bacterium]|nr:hypothetical protein [Candidatus Baltobacteraceae bacterium]
MQGTVILRSLGIVFLAASIAGCHPSVRSAAGQTPQPSSTTEAQANSTLPPDQATTVGPGDKYIAKTDAKLHGVNFAIWANGRPVGVIDWPAKGLDITKDMKGHANVLVVEWTRTQKNGEGTLTIATAKKTVFTTHVTPASPAKGRNSKQFIAPQSPIGR